MAVYRRNLAGPRWRRNGAPPRRDQRRALSCCHGSAAMRWSVPHPRAVAGCPEARSKSLLTWGRAGPVRGRIVANSLSRVATRSVLRVAGIVLGSTGSAECRRKPTSHSHWSSGTSEKRSSLTRSHNHETVRIATMVGRETSRESSVSTRRQTASMSFGRASKVTLPVVRYERAREPPALATVSSKVTRSSPSRPSMMLRTSAM